MSDNGEQPKQGPPMAGLPELPRENAVGIQGTPFSWNWSKIGPDAYMLTIYLLTGRTVVVLNGQDMDAFLSTARKVYSGIQIARGIPGS